MSLIYFTYAVYLTLTYLRPGIDVAKLKLKRTVCGFLIEYCSNKDCQTVR